MMSQSLPSSDRHELLNRRRLRESVLWALWQAIRLPVLAVLLVLEPFVSLALTAFGTVGILTAFFFKFAVDLPRFPFWQVMGISVGAIFVQMAYHALISICAR